MVIPSKYLDQYFEMLQHDLIAYEEDYPAGKHNAVMGWKMQFIEFPDGAKYQVKDLLNALAGQI